MFQSFRGNFVTCFDLKQIHERKKERKKEENEKCYYARQQPKLQEKGENENMKDTL